MPWDRGHPARLPLRSTDNSWWRISLPNISSPEQWVFGQVVTFSGDVACVPVAAAPPTPTSTPTATPTITPTPSPTPSETPTSTPTPRGGVTPTPTYTSTPSGPPPPALVSPIDGVSLNCTPTANLVWQPAGSTVSYQWEIEIAASASSPYDQWDSGAAGSGQSQVTVQVACDRWYRWRVRSVNILGTPGPYSPYGYFSVDEPPA
ncbi:MAG: hypothetical protein L0332_08430 [Chloroflexi bacterium]|nr:hypothetical protein [Chloroflexota bacterium]MCI0575411.1 hypothetical protein [Chloroflexota bacterium]MCI0645467.1 hypothetical protein [Chloroflexota bacterium]MCI0726734.1 hypothetical protein [Chloroflexota bacterium]